MYYNRYHKAVEFGVGIEVLLSTHFITLKEVESSSLDLLDLIKHLNTLVLRLTS